MERADGLCWKLKNALFGVFSWSFAILNVMRKGADEPVSIHHLPGMCNQHQMGIIHLMYKNQINTALENLMALISSGLGWSKSVIDRLGFAKLIHTNKTRDCIGFLSSWETSGRIRHGFEVWLLFVCPQSHLVPSKVSSHCSSLISNWQ